MTPDRCQRWRDGAHTWRHRSEGGFDRARYEVAAIAEDEAKRFVTRHHYSGSYPAAKLRYGLFVTAQALVTARSRSGSSFAPESNSLVGVAVLSVPMSAKALTGVFPGFVPFDESIELGRFVLLDEVPANGESFFLSQAFRLAARDGMRGVVSFSDPLPRRAAGGAVVVPGHVGTIYQAANALYLGRGTARTLYVMPDGTTLNARSVQKVRAQERGHQSVERLLQSLGAEPLRPGQDPAAWLHGALDAAGIRRLRHHGNHRYAFALGNAAQRRHAELAMAHRPYPKTPDLEAA